MLCCCGNTSDSESEEKNGKYKKSDTPKGEVISSSVDDKGVSQVQSKSSEEEPFKDNTTVTDTGAPSVQSKSSEVELIQDKTTVADTGTSPAQFKSSEGELIQDKTTVAKTVSTTVQSKSSEGESIQDKTTSPQVENVKEEEDVNVVDSEITFEEQLPVYAEGPIRDSAADERKSSLSLEPSGEESCQDYILSGEEEFEEMSQEALQAAVSRLEEVANRLECLAAKVPSGSGTGGAVESEALAQFVQAYDDILNGEFANFMTLSNQIGDDVAKAAALVNTAFQAQRSLLVVASKSKKPDDAAFVKLLGPLSQAIQDVSAFKDNNRRSNQFNHLSTLAEAIGALGWVTVSPTPGPFCKEMADAGMFYSNRVLKDYKEKDETHVNWVKCWLKIMSTLQSYIKDHHTTGISWNPKGGDAPAATPSSAPAPPPGGPPAPPPPPPVLPPTDLPPAGDGGGSDVKAALFADINKGADITKGLKKVTDSMKTHKNPALRQGPVPFKASGPPKVAPKPAPKPAAKPPRTELQDKKWIVEYHNDNPNIEIVGTELRQTVYVFKCTNTTIQVKNKINSITIDSCKKVAIVFDDLVSSLEFINCQSVQGQVIGKVPTVSIDKTDGCLVYLSENSKDAEIVTAKSSEMNICVPKGDGDFTEFAIPEQFKTTYADNKMTTVATDSI